MGGIKPYIPGEVDMNNGTFRIPLVNAGLLGLALIHCVHPEAFAQQLPLVYGEENTGAGCPKPAIPALDQAKAYAMLPDPFAKADGSGRIRKFSEWSCRRAEIKSQIEGIEIGPKPPKPKTVTATYSDGTLSVKVTGDNGKSLTLTSKIILPAGTGPFPALIGFGGGSGSLPANVFSSRNIAQIPFNTSQVTVDGQKNASDPFYQLYPELMANGQYSAWSWGVSRLIDGLELVKSQLPIDTRHLAVTGCSRWGKGALFAGAFDERIALTLPQEAGGGGVAAWRVSETIGEVEKLGATDHRWFMESMFKWAGANVPKLPHDHHELVAMIAPRAVLIIANGATDYVWLAEQSGYVSSRAAEEVYKAMGIPDRFGFTHSGHAHCGFPQDQAAQLNAFVDKFLLGKTANTAGVSTHPFSAVDYNKWIADWKGQTIAADATGIEEALSAGNGLHVIANAIHAEVVVEVGGRFSYQLANHLGQRIESGEAVDRKIFTRTTPAGIYLLKVTRKNISRSVKFIKS